jgi:RimJ/RimL family protein N-acetyltransferase
MIALALFEKTDFEDLIRWIDNADLLMKWSGGLFSFPLTHSSLEWYVKDTNIPGDSDAFVYKVVAEDGTSIGHISLGGISWKNRSARITRVLIGPEHRGKGCCSEMISAVLKIGFETLNLHRIGLGVYTNNDAAVSCYQKSGLKIEGIQRDILWQKDHFWSMIEMSILEDEWKEMNGVS